MTSTLEKFAQLLAIIESAENKARKLHAEISPRIANDNIRVLKNYLKRSRNKLNEAYRNYKENK